MTTDPIDITKARTEARKLFMHGSARAVYSWALEHGLALLDEADENDRTIQTLRRQRDEAEAALDRVRELAEALASTPLVGSSSEEQWEFDTRRIVAGELRDAVKGDDQ